jgi:cobalt/nickel transport system permease protein
MDALVHGIMDNSGTLHRLDARVKLMAAGIVLVICVSTPPDRFGVFAAYFGLVAGALMVTGVSWRGAARRLVVPLPFIILCAVFIPFLHADTMPGGYSLGVGGLRVSRSGLLVFWNVTAKACFGILCVTALTESTAFPDLLRGLEQLRFPKLGILILSFAHRYLSVLRDEAVRMKRALDSRCYRGRWLVQAGVIGRLLGTLFLRSYERGERVYMAMVARGFDGGMPDSGNARLRKGDYVFLAGTAAVFLALRMGAA